MRDTVIRTTRLLRKNAMTRPRSVDRRLAFSLVDLVVVMLIVGILSAVAIPRFGAALSRQRLQVAARRVKLDIERTRDLALSTRTEQSIRFYTSSSDERYKILNLPDPDHPGEEYQVFLGRHPYNANLDSADFGGDKKLTFSGFGLPEDGGSVTLEVGVNSSTISVDGSSGQVQLQ